MHKRDITYKDFNDQEVTDTYYFHISETEIIELQVEHEGGVDAMIRRIMETRDYKALIAEFKRIILLSYGEKSDDGKRFVKSEALREAFSQTAAFNALFLELATNDKSAVEFIKGIVPSSMVENITKGLQADDTAAMVEKFSGGTLPPPAETIQK